VSKRTLLTINNYYYPRAGAEVVFLEQIRLLEEAGWNVVPFAMRHPESLPSPWQNYFAEELQLGQDYSFTEKVKRIFRVIYSFESREKLKKLLDDIEPDACLVHNVYHHLSPSVLSLLKERGLPIIMTLHDLKLACPAYKMLNDTGICERCKGGQYRNLLKYRCMHGSKLMSAIIYLEATLHRYLDTYDANVDRFIVPSAFLIDKMAEWGVKREKMVHIRNFVNLEPFQEREEAGKYFLYFGRLAPEKGLHTLIRAAAKVRAPLRIIGTGPEEEALKKLSTDLGHSSVKFFGYLKGQLLVDAVRNARVVVLPSEWYENAPVSILEAYAVGVPVIGAAIGGIPEQIEDGVTGSTYPSGDTDALAGLLTWYMNMENEQVLSMGRHGRALLEREFSGDAHLKNLLKLLSEMDILSGDEEHSALKLVKANICE
jgi:glycosyltransferase involved in cell wall biosynthesis